MIALISPAKTFASKPALVGLGQPSIFKEESFPIVEHALSMTEDELKSSLKLSAKLATEARQNWLAWIAESSPEALALSYYSGMVFKKIGMKDFNDEDWAFVNNHLRICSFVYGLLTPDTLIRPYRMEGTVRLEDGQRIFDYWKDRLTDALIEACLADDGVLLNLASDEMQSLFHWDKVCARLKVINFYFETRQADGSLKTIVIYCKMARGAMVRAMVKGRLTNPEDLKSVQVEGFQFVPERSDETNWYFETIA